MSEKEGCQQERCNNIITRDSLRPPCKRQRTRSTTRCVTPTITKEDASSTTSKDPIVATKNAIVGKTTNNVEEGNVKQKCRRQWEQWGEDEQEIFFQGVADFGKDYTKIRNLMKKKLKGKNEDTKTKEQIRFFYHNTWSKISKNLKLKHEPDPQKGYRREIHYMLCLWELRKKGGHGFGHKIMNKLNELVTKGDTYLRYKGRNIHLRPPNRYLRKLYRDCSIVPDIVLPKHVNIEFLPNTNTAFNYVQKHAFNPRLRFTNVSINAKFSEVFDMFDKRFTDLCSRDPMSLQIYPLVNDIDVKEFASHIVSARNRIENHEKLQDVPIVLENTELSPKNDVVSEDEGGEEDTFPKVFGKQKESKENLSNETVIPFPGYWTYHTAETIYMRTLYVALGEVDLLKFKYEWKLEKKDVKSFFPADSSQFLRNLCSSEKKQRKEAQKLQAIKPNSIKSTPVSNSLPVVVPGIIRRSTSSLGVPFKPRPGRKSRQSHSPMIHRRTIAPRYNGMNKLLKNAVAVNIIPQPPQLVQYANMLPDSTKLVNSGTYVNGKSSLPNSPVEITENHNGVVVTEATSSSVIHEEVMEEGYNEHFKSLTNILASSTLQKQTSDSQGYNKLQPQIKTEHGPKSPSLDWLNSEQSLDITMSSFINVCEMQAIQQMNEQNQLKDSLAKVKLKANSTSADPPLPEFHSGESTHSLFGLSFE